MSDKHETPAAIIAEMLEFCSGWGEDVDVTVKVGLIYGWACRLKESAERKQASLEDALSHCREYAQKIERENEEGETRLDAEEIIATVDNEFAGIRPERAPGNVAAMREALEWVAQFVEEGADDEFSVDGQNLLTAAEKARDALAAPARNADRFQTADEAMEEWNKYPQSRYKGCRVCPHGDASMVSPTHLTLAEWLFAPAEGGAE